MLKTIIIVCIAVLFSLSVARFMIDSDTKLVIIFSLMGFVCAVMFICLYLRERRKAVEHKAPMGALGTSLLYVFLMLYLILACFGSAVAIDTKKPLTMLPVFTYGLAVASASMWRRAKNV